MSTIKILDLRDGQAVCGEEAALVKGGPLEIRELVIRASLSQ